MARIYHSIPIPPKNDIKNLYIKNNMSTREIANMYGVSHELIWRWCKSLNLKKSPAQRNQRGLNSPCWKTKPSSDALHDRVEKKYGKPKECEICHTTDHAKRYDWANISGKYIDVDDFIRLCRLCHMHFDRIEENDWRIPL